MSREIKFRSWGRNYALMFCTDKTMYTPSHISSRGNSCTPIDYEPPYEDDKAIVMQYTGMKDKDNVEIYEGDIIQGDIMHDNRFLGTMGVVVYDEKQGSFANKNCSGLSLMHKLYHIKVIGNVFDNPEIFIDDPELLNINPE